jgi:hypothetical protein
MKIIAAASKRLFIGAGIYSLTCAPAILLLERLDWPQPFFVITQFVGTVLCLPAAGTFLWSTRGLRFNWARCLAVVACALSGLWLAFVAHVWLALDFSGLD